MSWLQHLFSFCALALLLQISMFMLYILQLPCMMHHTQNEPIKHVMAASCYCFLWTSIVAADQDVHAAAMCDAPEPK